MIEVMTCMHHQNTEEEQLSQEVQSKITHVCASTPNETLMAAASMQSKANFTARVNSPCRDPPQDEISHLANSRKTFLQSNAYL